MFRVHLVAFFLLRYQRCLQRFNLRTVPKGVGSSVVFRVPIRPNHSARVVVAPSRSLIAFLIRFRGVSEEFRLFGRGFAQHAFISAFRRPFSEKDHFCSGHGRRRTRSVSSFRLARVLFVGVLAPCFPSKSARRYMSPFTRQVTGQLSCYGQTRPSKVREPELCVPFTEPDKVYGSMRVMYEDKIRRLSPISCNYRSFAFTSIGTA